MTGFLCIDKPKDITSFLAVAKVRRIMGEKKAGHCGTLDPMATGVLPIMLGGATRFLQYLPDHSKAYIATMRLGIVTDTLDITGTVISESTACKTLEDVVEASKKYVGDIMQIPPMYSAIKKDGVRMYDLARQGIEVEREPRPVTINKLEISECKEKDEYSLYIECSSGTYIRTLIDDIGRDLECGAVMTSLRRTQAAGFVIEKSVTIEELENASHKENYLISVEEALDTYEKLVVTAGQANRFRNGGALNLDRIKTCKCNGLYRVYSSENEFLGLGNADLIESSLKVERIYVGR